MVLSHITQRTRVVIISSALFHTNRLTECNLDIRNVFVIPEWLKKGIAEANDFNILHHFLT
ncbi:hypothetical protein D3C75_1228180 [compost metagenome]